MTPTARAAPGSPSAQLEAFIAKFDPEIARRTREARKALRRRFPTANELVYDNYNALAIGYCTTERPSDCIVSLAVTPRGPALSFYYGATLADPQNILSGSGNQNRYVRLTSAAMLDDPALSSLIDAAVSRARTPLPAAGRGKLVIKSISAKQRPRR
jgi:hypothetical protein